MCYGNPYNGNMLIIQTTDLKTCSINKLPNTHRYTYFGAHILLKSQNIVLYTFPPPTSRAPTNPPTYLPTHPPISQLPPARLLLNSLPETWIQLGSNSKKQ